SGSAPTAGPRSAGDASVTLDSLAAAHAPLLDELSELRKLARQVLEAHRAEDGRRLHEVSALVADLRRHTQGFTPPRGACSTWRELWERLSKLEALLLLQMDREEQFQTLRRRGFQSG
ncbi:MAG: hypothetical protein ACXWLM_13310, partial [Myxococcales bacterium]